jgi:hypothetical protein
MSGAGCNTVTLGGAAITPTVSSSTPPTAAGGTIVSGTYSLTSATQYIALPCVSNAGSGTVQSTIVVNASAMTVQIYSVSSFQGGTDESRSTATFTASDSALTSTPTCGSGVDAGAGTPSPYTATSTTIAVFSFDNEGLDAGTCATNVEVYTLQ